MDALFDEIQKLISSDFKIEKIIPIIFLYIIVLWLMFSVWVFKDSYKRYNNNGFIAAGFFLLVLPINFPALVFYLIIRPETDEELIGHLAHGDFHGLDHLEGGVNVPVVNFIGKNGFEMSLNLKITKPEELFNKSAQDLENSSMNVNVSWDSKSQDFEKAKQEKSEPKKMEKSEIEQSQSESSFMNGVKSIFTNLKMTLKDIKNSVFSTLSSLRPKKDEASEKSAKEEEKKSEKAEQSAKEEMKREIEKKEEEPKAKENDNDSKEEKKEEKEENKNKEKKSEEVTKTDSDNGVE